MITDQHGIVLPPPERLADDGMPEPISKVSEQSGTGSRAVTSGAVPVSTLSTLSTDAEVNTGAATDLLAGLRDGEWLDQQEFPELRYAVNGLIPEGAAILIGPPKVGKSYLLGDVLLAVSSGGSALGKIKLEGERPVLYLALEDGDRRMQKRCRDLLGEGVKIPPAFHYLTKVQPRQLVATIEAFLQRRPNTALIVVDTLGKVMPEARVGESSYQRDYRIAGSIKAVADAQPGLSIIVVHHDRKAFSEDFVDSVSGTNGLAGAMDTIMVLVRARGSKEGMLKVTGRDVPEGEYALTVKNGHWTLDGDSLSDAATRAKLRADSDGLGDRSTQIIHIVEQHPKGIGPTELASKMGMGANHAGQYLGRLAASGRIAKIGRGLYAGVECVASVETPDQSAAK